jgi:uncharacterized protein (TIGR03000 family)
MYSVVLATMLTVGADSTAWCHGCRGCHGCWGCHGCYGCSGCWGYHGCYGCSGCWGCYGCSGCWGCYGGSGYYAGCWGGYGCSGCYGCYGGVAYAAPVRPVTVVSAYPPVTTGTAVVANPRPGDQSLTPTTAEERDAVRDTLRRVRQTAQAAQITVRVPQNARLYVNNELSPLTSTTRALTTPSLQPGRQYYYDLKMEVTENGRSRTQRRQVVVSAGRQVTVDFGTGSAPVATASR